MAHIDTRTLSARPPANARVPLVLADKSIGAMLASAGGDPWMLGAVRVATTTNGTLATAYENGDTVDGVVLATGDRILLKNQSSGAENGIYTVNASGAPTRATDADATGELYAGLKVHVLEGTTNARTTWGLTTAGTITIGSTAQTWERAVLQSYAAVPTALTADGTDTAADAGKLLICNAASVITRTLPSSLDAVGHWIEYLNLSEYPVKISAGTDGINAAGFDAIYVLKGSRVRLIYASASDPKWLCADFGNSAQAYASSGDFLSATSETLADVPGMAFRLSASQGFWFEFDIIYTSAAATTGIKLGITLTNLSNLSYNAMAPVAADGVSAMFFGTGAASGDAVTTSGVETVSGAPRYLAKVNGIAVASVDGSLLQLQAATEVASSAITIKQRTRGRCWWHPTAP